MAFNQQLIKVPVKYGIVGGVLAVIVFLVLYLLEQNPLIHARLFDLVLIPIMVFFCIKEFRDRVNYRELFFWQGMTTGFFVYILIAFFSSLFVYGFLNLYDVNILLEFIQANEEGLQEQRDIFIENFGQEKYQVTLENIRSTEPYHVALDDFIKKLGIGLFYTIIISVILRRKNI